MKLAKNVSDNVKQLLVQRNQGLETIKGLMDSMIFQGYKTRAFIFLPILTRSYSYFTTIKQLKYKTPEWQLRFTLKALTRNLIALAFF